MTHFLRHLFVLLRTGRNKSSEARTLVLLVAALVLFGTLGFYAFESHQLEGASALEKLGTSTWWSIVTMTTVGYGDFSPTTWQGRFLIGVPLMVLGIGILGYAIGVLTSAVIETQAKEAKGMVPYTGSGHIVICNCPTTDLVDEVCAEVHADPQWARRDVVVVTDVFESLPESLRGKVVFVAGNPCRERVLQDANITAAHRVMIFGQDPGDEDCDSRTLGVLVTIRALDPDVYVVAECQQHENRKLLWSARANEVVGAGALRAELMVQGLKDPGINQVLGKLLTNTTGHQFYIEELRAFAGTFGELEAKISAQGRYALLGLIRGGEHLFLPPNDTRLEPGQRVILIGDQRPSGL